jgi:hypothetical protein
MTAMMDTPETPKLARPIEQRPHFSPIAQQASRQVRAAGDEIGQR